MEDLAEALLAQVKALARDQAFNDKGKGTKLKPLEILDGVDFYEEVQKFESFLIKKALAHTRGNQKEAARLLGIKGPTLHAKIKLFNIRNVRGTVRAHNK